MSSQTLDIKDNYIVKRQFTEVFKKRLLAIKRNTFGPVLMRQMNLEPIMQNEVSQKEKNKYRILMHIYGM